MHHIPQIKVAIYKELLKFEEQGTINLIENVKKVSKTVHKRYKNDPYIFAKKSLNALIIKEIKM